MNTSCPICRRDLPAETRGAALGPFCSARCRTIDLGRWLDGAYRIPCEGVPDDDDLAVAYPAPPRGTA